jgi:NhaP-type Na+/H+ or K+/H+ antiporter
MMGQANKRKWMSSALQQLALLSIAVLAWAVIDVSPGNSFIAVFVTGLVIKNGYESAGEQMVEFSDVWGQLLNLFVFAIFGMMVGRNLAYISPMMGLYAILSLTIVRMLPAGISLIGTGLHRSSVLFLGWFGPRGLASIVLGLIFLKEEANVPGEEFISLIVLTTVAFSVFAHGISAAPGIKLYAAQVEKLPEDAPECQDVVKMPLRV